VYKQTLLCISILISAVGVADLADPTKPYDTKDATESTRTQALQTLQLSSIINSQGRKVAIINNKAYQVGESVMKDYTVLDIQRSFVVLSGPDGNFNLKFPLLDKTSTDQKVGDKP